MFTKFGQNPYNIERIYMYSVLKFGGSSLATCEKVKKVALFIKDFLKSGQKPIVVVSAMGKTTSNLITLAENFNGKRETKAELITIGELVSCDVLSLALDEVNISSKILLAKDIPILTKGDPLNSIITYINKDAFSISEDVIIVPGFQGYNKTTTCLSRGGSDTTAVALASVLGCEVNIYTDVDGYHVLDPNKYESPKLERINIYSAIEQAYGSGKVLDKRCLEIANKFKPKLTLLKSCERQGTQLVYGQVEGNYIDSVSLKNDVCFVRFCTNRHKNIQLSFQNNNRPLFFEQNQLLNIVELAYEFKPAKLKKALCFAADYIIISGSGLNSEKTIKKVQVCIEKTQTCAIKLAIHPTFIKIFVTKGTGEQVMKNILHEFKS